MLLLWELLPYAFAVSGDACYAVAVGAVVVSVLVESANAAGSVAANAVRHAGVAFKSLYKYKALLLF